MLLVVLYIKTIMDRKALFHKQRLLIFITSSPQRSAIGRYFRGVTTEKDLPPCIKSCFSLCGKESRFKLLA